MKKMLVCAFFLFLAAPVLAGNGDVKTIRGRVVGLSCYMEGQKNVGRTQTGLGTNESCTVSALDAGEPVGIVEEETGDIYIAISDNQSTEKLLPNLENMVEVTGQVGERNGVRTITLEEVTDTGVPVSAADPVGDGSYEADGTTDGSSIPTIPAAPLGETKSERRERIREYGNCPGGTNWGERR